MADQRLSEFRERAESAVRVPQPEALLRRGRTLRRRRQVVPATVAAACTALAFGVVSATNDDARTEPGPAGTPTPSVTQVTSDASPPLLGQHDGFLTPGTYVLDN